jgi:hypothetical protein
MTEGKHPRTRVALACERFAREISAAIKDFEAVRDIFERVADLPFAEVDDVAGAHEINARTDAVKSMLASACGPVRKNAEEFEQRVKRISVSPSQ